MLEFSKENGVVKLDWYLRFPINNNNNNNNNNGHYFQLLCLQPCSLNCTGKERRWEKFAIIKFFRFKCLSGESINCFKLILMVLKYQGR